MLLASGFLRPFVEKPPDNGIKFFWSRFPFECGAPPLNPTNRLQPLRESYREITPRSKASFQPGTGGKTRPPGNCVVTTIGILSRWACSLSDATVLNISCARDSKTNPRHRTGLQLGFSKMFCIRSCFKDDALVEKKGRKARLTSSLWDANQQTNVFLHPMLRQHGRCRKWKALSCLSFLSYHSAT